MYVVVVTDRALMGGRLANPFRDFPVMPRKRAVSSIVMTSEAGD